MKITINGKTYEGPKGSNLSVINNKVYINGKEVTDTLFESPVLIKVEGNTGDIKVDQGSVEVTGNAYNIEAGGSVKANHVSGSVKAYGSVHCGNVGYYVEAGGSVNCGKVAGQVWAGGSINIR